MVMMVMMMIQGDKLQSPAVRQEERRLFQRAVQYISDLWQLKWVVLIRGVRGVCEHVAFLCRCGTQPQATT